MLPPQPKTPKTTAKPPQPHTPGCPLSPPLKHPLLTTAFLLLSCLYPSQNASAIGLVTTAGDALHHADLARSHFGVSGQGIKIGIISDSFNRLGKMNLDIASNDLPSNVTIVRDQLNNTNTDEGRAMAQIIHDLAPQAKILFHSAYNNTVPFGQDRSYTLAKAIDNLVAAGCNIIVDDIPFYSEPVFQDGPAAQAVDRAKNAGIAYFSAAGNSANQAFQHSFSPITVGSTTWNNFDINQNESSGDQWLNLQIQPGKQLFAALHWADPYPSVGIQPDYQMTDFDLLAYRFNTPTTTTPTLITSSHRSQANGADPWEFLTINNPSTFVQYVGLAVRLTSGPADKLLQLQWDNASNIDDDNLNSPVIFGHAAAAGAFAVAAARFDNPQQPEFFTSAGPTTILFDTHGNPTYQLRQTPQATGIDGANTTFFGSSDYDHDGYLNFFGTSAAAPHVAAVAALVMNQAQILGYQLEIDELYNLLKTTATDIYLPGPDSRTGYGLVNAYNALQTLTHRATTPEPLSLALTTFAFLALTLHLTKRPPAPQPLSLPRCHKQHQQ